jgi:hypothetical protein
MNLEQQIVEALLNDARLNFKSKSGAKALYGGTCPECKEKEVFISLEKPYQLKCNRTNKCGYSESTKARYSHLWSNLADKFPATDSDPHATAKAYMSMVRGFPLTKTERWFEQGVMKLRNGRHAETVRFLLWDGCWWDRLINDRDIRDNTKNGEKPNKADFKFGTQYKNKCWTPPGQELANGDHVYIVEGIFHAIAFHLCGYKVAAAFSSNNLPRELIAANKGRNITWCLAYDAGMAGEFASVKYLREINEMKEPAQITLPHSANADWDDLYREEKLNDAYLEECKWRGRMLAAKDVKRKAFALYCWRHFTYTVITFDKETYSVRVVSDKLAKELDNEKIAWNNDDFNVFVGCISVTHIANCELNFLHIEKDKFTQERKYLFDVHMPKHRKPFLVGFTPSNLGDAKAISTSLLNQTDFGHFKGGSRELDFLTKKWSSQAINTVETVPFIGYEETSGAYVFPQVGYQAGRYFKTNEHGYLHFGNCSIKTSLGGMEFVHSTKFDQSFFPDFIKVFDMNGVAALGFFTLSLFAQQVKKVHQNLTFMEITGEKEAGKSTLIRFLWKMLGRTNYEGVDILSMSASAEARTLAQVSNLPVVFLESDKEVAGNQKGGRANGGVDWERYKKISDLNGAIASRGVKTNDNQTNDLIFRGSLVISQNATIAASPAILSRIVHLHYTTAHKRIENIPIADRLKQMDVEHLSGYLHHVLTHEEQWLAAFFAAFPKHRARLTKNPGIKSQRVVDNHAQVMAAVDALQVLFTNFRDDSLDKALTHIEQRAMDRDMRLSAEHPIVQQFWETFHWINDQTMFISDEKGERNVKVNRLNHSKDPKYIAVNLNDWFEHARKRGQEVISIKDLKEVLKESKHYRFLHQARVWSAITNDQVRCWVFTKPSDIATN